ncbi:hypothetical protein [Pseudanabaena sp. PCC 6802]|uniref:hypothetical protein n=1 Tax=Pseudanabaena sp. PCC 6802 TaxID=118173 RepID=UPI00035E83A7|nr:hypothetical protein [Pseudanabaena sp. PCC 6802]
MTVERWTDEMLDRLATTVAQNSEQIRELRELFSDMRANQAMLQQEQSEMSRQFMHTIGIIAQQQSEIAGLRTETNRMLDILINQRQGEDDGGQQSA